MQDHQKFGEKLSIVKQAVRKVAKVAKHDRSVDNPTNTDQTCPMATILGDRS